ncbi:MAG: hypothetical protein SFT81_03505 [Candidatus Caenarcaniphilales bacterium]|nr:hypothetical protein [Candidatus Caenarcaniphilales bacterium]
MSIVPYTPKLSFSDYERQISASNDPSSDPFAQILETAISTQAAKGKTPFTDTYTISQSIKENWAELQKGEEHKKNPKIAKNEQEIAKLDEKMQSLSKLIQEDVQKLIDLEKQQSEYNQTFFQTVELSRQALFNSPAAAADPRIALMLEREASLASYEKPFDLEQFLSIDGV